MTCSNNGFRGCFALFSALRGCLDCLKTVYGLFVAGFVIWFVIVCGLSKKLFLGVVCIKNPV